MNYAHYNSTYKKVLFLSRQMGAPKPKEIFKLGGLEVSGSKVQGWQVGSEHKNFRIITEEELLSFIDGLIAWVDEK